MHIDLNDITFPKLLKAQAAAFGAKKTALRKKRLGIWQSCSWQQYLDNVRNLALGLHSLGFNALFKRQGAFFVEASLFKFFASEGFDEGNGRKNFTDPRRDFAFAFALLPSGDFDFSVDVRQCEKQNWQRHERH